MAKILKVFIPAAPTEMWQSIYWLPNLVILTFQKTLILEAAKPTDLPCSLYKLGEYLINLWYTEVYLGQTGGSLIFLYKAKWFPEWEMYPELWSDDCKQMWGRILQGLDIFWKYLLTLHKVAGTFVDSVLWEELNRCICKWPFEWLLCLRWDYQRHLKVNSLYLKFTSLKVHNYNTEDLAWSVFVCLSITQRNSLIAVMSNAIVAWKEIFLIQ